MSYKTVNHKHPEGGYCSKIWQHITNIKRKLLKKKRKRKLLAEFWKNNILFFLKEPVRTFALKLDLKELMSRQQSE